MFLIRLVASAAAPRTALPIISASSRIAPPPSAIRALVSAILTARIRLLVKAPLTKHRTRHAYHVSTAMERRLCQSFPLVRFAAHLYAGRITNHEEQPNDC